MAKVLITIRLWEQKILEPCRRISMSHFNFSFPFGSRELYSRSRSRPPIPQSSYYFGPPPVDSAYGTNPIGHLGIHHPREIFRVERDYTGGELVQFSPTYPLELEGRVCDPSRLQCY